MTIERVIVALATISCIICGLNAKPSRFESSVVQKTDFVGCNTFEQEGKGDFSLDKKYYFPHGNAFYIAAVNLKKRTSFYTCEPKDVKYGIDADGKRWWVDRGCEAIFDIVECPESGNTLDMNSPVFRTKFLKRTGMFQSSINDQSGVNTEERFKNVEYVVV